MKPEKIAATSAVALEQALVLPATMTREGIDKYKGSKNDTVNVVVEGVLPFRSYGWRNNRDADIVFDEYRERTIPVAFGGDVYSAVRLTDEQANMDFDGWAKLASKQVEAVGKGLESKAVDAILAAPYQVTLELDSANLRNSLNRAKKVLDRLNVPAAGRVIYVGSDMELALLNDDKLNLASSVGDAQAQSALVDATLGRRSGFTFVSANELPEDQGIAASPGAFIFATGAPAVPSTTAVTGATASYKGVAVRWLKDYEMARTRERSLVNTYAGFRHVDDVLVGEDAQGQRFVSTHTHFVRAIKLVLDGTDSLPRGLAAGDKGDELARISGVGTPFGA
ncbi:MAG: hypothetical protein ACRCYU_12200 [Nocardioides sp.]